MRTTIHELIAGVGLLLAVYWGASWAARAYPRTGRGLALFVIDHTWSLPNTVAGSLYLLLHLAMRHSIDRNTTFHSGQIHIVERLNRHYAMTIGPVVAGVTPALRRHEDVHVFQARVLGPLYLPLVGLNYVLFSLVPVWLLYHDHERWPIRARSPTSPAASTRMYGTRRGRSGATEGATAGATAGTTAGTTKKTNKPSAFTSVTGVT